MRSLSRVLVLACVGLALTLGLFVGAAALDAQSRPRARAVANAQTAIALGEFASVGGQAGSDNELELAIRSALTTLPSVTVSPDRARARFVVTGSVVELTHHVLAQGEREVRCRVSIVVSDARGGAVRAMLEGRAGVRGGGTEQSMRRSAMRGAVASALRTIAQVR
ncbi:MAG: hypothetical protein ACK6CU_03115 [Deltaproteobacteria bacterium]|jgi:hypothetical protein